MPSSSFVKEPYGYRLNFTCNNSSTIINPIEGIDAYIQLAFNKQKGLYEK